MADMRKAFLADIIENIDDDTPRLVFADWLEEQGDAARAEFIRLQCRAAAETPWPRPWHGPDLRFPPTPRESELIAEHGAEWKKEAPTWATRRFAFRRGFVGVVGTTPGRWLKDGAGLCRRVPVEGLELRVAKGVQFDQIASLPQWKYVRLLKLFTRAAFSEALARFFGSADLRRLATLDCTCDGTGDEALAPILASDRLAGLRCLTLGWGRLSVRGAAALAASDLLARLKSLFLNGSAAYGPGVIELVRSPGVASLEELSLWDIDVGEPLIALASSPHLANLRRLHLGHTFVPDKAVRALASSPYLTNLTELSIEAGWADPEVGRMIGESDTLIRLRRLRLFEDGDCSPILARLAARRRERGIE